MAVYIKVEGMYAGFERFGGNFINQYFAIAFALRFGQAIKFVQLINFRGFPAWRKCANATGLSSSPPVSGGSISKR